MVYFPATDDDTPVTDYDGPVCPYCLEPLPTEDCGGSYCSSTCAAMADRDNQKDQR